MQRGIRLFGLPDPASASLVSESSSRSSARCRPPQLSLWVHPLVRFRSLQSFSSYHPLGQCRAPSMGFLPSSRYQSAESTNRELPGSLRSVLGVSHALDGFLLCRPCGFVSPRYHVQGSTLQGVPLARSRAGSSPTSALLPFTRRSCRRFAPMAPDRRARLQGFAPLASPWRTVVV